MALKFHDYSNQINRNKVINMECLQFTSMVYAKSGKNLIWKKGLKRWCVLVHGGKLKHSV